MTRDRANTRQSNFQNYNNEKTRYPRTRPQTSYDKQNYPNSSPPYHQKTYSNYNRQRGRPPYNNNKTYNRRPYQNLNKTTENTITPPKTYESAHNTQDTKTHLDNEYLCSLSKITSVPPEYSSRNLTIHNDITKIHELPQHSLSNESGNPNDLRC